ncbi:putative RNA polymerase III, second largest subunit, partial [Pseudoloma neurophilia]
MSLTGYDIEDAVILNKQAIDRGMARITLFKDVDTEITRYADGSCDMLVPFGYTENRAEQDFFKSRDILKGSLKGSEDSLKNSLKGSLKEYEDSLKGSLKESQDSLKGSEDSLKGYDDSLKNSLKGYDGSLKRSEDSLKNSTKNSLKESQDSLKNSFKGSLKRSNDLEISAKDIKKDIKKTRNHNSNALNQ